MKTIICTTPINHLKDLKKNLKKRGKLIYKPNITKRGLTKILKDDKKIDTIFCNPNRQGYILNKEILKNSSIKLINTASTGLNHINQDDCRELGIKIFSLTKDFKLLKKLPSTSELSFGLMINLQRNLIRAFQSVKNKKWDYIPFIGQELSSLTIGIIGLGRLGSFMAKYAKAFGMKIVYFDPLKKTKKYKKTDLKKLIQISDVISLHAHVSNETRYMINKRVLRFAKKNQLLLILQEANLLMKKT